MELIDASHAQDDDLRYLVREVKPVKLHYVTSGRNAWWSTWITRYSPGCMHSTMDSAKQFCESQRVQGTVFYIDELPSIAFIADNRALVVSEINTDSFLKRIDVELLTTITTVFPVSTMTLRQMMYVFRPYSPLWPKDYPRLNSAIVSFSSAGDTMVELHTEEELFSYASSSVGPSYYLNWSTRRFQRDRSALHGIATSLRSRMSDA
ncbi:MAG: hypothetical protein NTW37_06700 [Proteobacteria bacterium]|nr:hypothetical protein [Pseudomonadota bacterium]